MRSSMETTIPCARPRLGSEGRGRPLPLATVALIAVHTILQTLIAWQVVPRPGELALVDLTFGRVLQAAAAGMLFHSDTAHLLKHMIMLMIFGAILEPKVGSRRLLAAYVVGGLTGSLVCIDLTLAQVRLPGDPGQALFYPALGATGGIGGLIGLFALGLHLPRTAIRWPKSWWTPFVLPARLAGSLALGFVLAASLADAAVAAVRHCLPSILGGYLGGVTGGVLLALTCDPAARGVAQPCPIDPTRIRAVLCGQNHASGDPCRLGTATSSASAGRLVRFPR